MSGGVVTSLSEAACRFSAKPGVGRLVGLPAAVPCPLCEELSQHVRVETGLRYVDPHFETYRWGTFEELGPAERWETVYFCPEFDRIVVEPCGHAARGARAVHWRALLAASAAAADAPVGVLPVRRDLAGHRPTPGGNQLPVRYRGAATVRIPVVPESA